MTFQDMRAYSTGLLKASFQNKTTLNKLSTSEDGNLLFDGKEIKSDKGGVGVLIYDTKEQVVGCWIDNKPVYQIVTSKEIENIDTLIYEKILNSNEENGIEKIKILQYTKITDEPGSFDPSKLPNTVLNMNIDFSNIYSTEERIVGSWINGKPIYQKVIPFITTLNNYIWVETPELINDKEQIIQSFVVGNVTYMPIMGDVDKDGSNYVRIYSMRNTVFDITHVIIQYTKTTDEENSFTPDMIIDHENITDAEIKEAATADKI